MNSAGGLYSTSAQNGNVWNGSRKAGRHEFAAVMYDLRPKRLGGGHRWSKRGAATYVPSATSGNQTAKNSLAAVRASALVYWHDVTSQAASAVLAEAKSRLDQIVSNGGGNNSGLVVRTAALL
jgi:hypothetical protein